MKNLRWWAPLASALVALAFGFVPYLAFTHSGKIPASLRDNPWPMELIAVGATLVTIVFTVQAFRQKRARIVAVGSSVLATLGTAVFLLLIHVASYQLPGAPRELAMGTMAPDFALPDAKGESTTLASMRGHPVLLVFHRGVW